MIQILNGETNEIELQYEWPSPQVVVGPPGVAGLSAYQIALLNGFVGTEAEWLASLGGGSTFETVNRNLSAYPHAINYASGRISSIVYTLSGPTTITKTINYTGDRVTSIVLSGATPSGISLTKTITYTGDNITGVAYS
jgi:hypothetical protein